ncbi:MAG: hypothetical protein H6850_04140 [Alphaproteobacteria bacterium]|nr:MAG: hypothetical protein H6850_04140 [Alphaproteobacteria bacterium]
MRANIKAFFLRIKNITISRKADPRVIVRTTPKVLEREEVKVGFGDGMEGHK